MRKLYYTLFIYLIFLLCSINLKANEIKPIDTLVICEITNSKLYAIIDSLIIHEKKCEYYSEDLEFLLEITECFNIFTISINSFKHKWINNKPHMFKGCYCRGHLVFLYNSTYYDFFEPIEKKYTYFTRDSSLKPDNINDINTIILDSYEGSLYSYWFYYYILDIDKFINIDKLPNCK